MIDVVIITILRVWDISLEGHVIPLFLFQAEVGIREGHVTGVRTCALPMFAGRTPDLLAICVVRFFGPELVHAVDELVRAGTAVVVAGLCVTFDGRPFEPLASLMAVAEDVTKLTAVCAVCGRDAAFHVRTVHDDVADARSPSTAHVGGAESYEARCRQHR